MRVLISIEQNSLLCVSVIATLPAIYMRCSPPCHSRCRRPHTQHQRRAAVIKTPRDMGCCCRFILYTVATFDSLACKQLTKGAIQLPATNVYYNL
jgi:hypothetical protein